jgi:cytochrome b involved in lipid metabolism
MEGLQLASDHMTANQHSVGLVIDNIVYDCTNFLKDHPGGTTVLESFGGAECSCKSPP